VEKFTYPDRKFDTVVSFRLFHHFPNTDIAARGQGALPHRGQVRCALLFQPASFTSIRNKVVEKLTGKQSKKYATSLKEVEGYFKGAAFN